MSRFVSQTEINGNLVMVLNSAPTIPMQDAIGEGGDIMLSTAAAVAYNGLHRGASDPDTWIAPDIGYMRWYQANGPGTYQGRAFVEGDVCLSVNVGGTVTVIKLNDIVTSLLVASAPSGWVAPEDGQAAMYVASGVGNDVFSSGKDVAQGDVVLASRVGSTTKVWVFDYSEA